jgi:hypothetical protein
VFLGIGVDQSLRDLLVARICSGHIRVRVALAGKERIVRVEKPSRSESYEAAEIYRDSLREAELQGLYSDDELLAFLIENNFWDESKQSLLENLPKEIEEFKVTLFKSTFKSDERKLIRKALGVAKAKLEDLCSERNQFNYLSCSGTAAMTRARFLVSCGLRPKKASFALDDILSSLSRSQISENDFRDISRNDPWRSIWNSHKAEGSLFGVSPIDYTDEQRTLVSWSTLYDNIFQHPKCPSDEIIADNDMLDGWMITQRREREIASTNSDADELVKNPKIRGSQEVFLVAETPDDARKVLSLNSDVAKATQKSRFAKLNKLGTVDEADMPDTKQRIKMQAARTP